jgi:hypothetical protein
MLHRLHRIRKVIEERFPKSKLEVLTEAQLWEIKRQHPTVPEHVLKFFEIVGCGSIGPSRYMVYALIEAIEIFGKGSEEELDGILLIGDDFAGHHEAYDTKHGWQFGTIGSSAQFEAHSGYSDFIDFIEDWYVKE